jgi:hypothetical protein
MKSTSSFSSSSSSRRHFGARGSVIDFCSHSVICPGGRLEGEGEGKKERERERESMRTNPPKRMMAYGN